MSYENENEYGIEPAPKIGKLSFIQKHGLEPVLTKLQKATPAAIATLTEKLNSQNEDVQMKAAEMLLKYAVAAADLHASVPVVPAYAVPV